MTTRRRWLFHRTPGNVLVLAGIIAPVIFLLAFGAVNITTKMLQRAALEDALRLASRSAVNQLAYASLAGNAPQASAAGVRTAKQTGITTLVDTISGAPWAGWSDPVPGILESPTAMASRVVWQINPPSGQCRFTDGSRFPGAPTTQPLVCAEVTLRMEALVPGMGEWHPTIVAKETIDSLR